MGEILIGVLISGGFLLIGIVATMFGQEYYAKSNHKRKLELIKKELIFNRKIVYFEKISTLIEGHIKNYASLLFLLRDINQVANDLNLPDLNLKEGQLKIKIMTTLKEVSEENLISIMPTGSSLYFKNGTAHQKLANYIINHTRIISLTAILSKGNFKDSAKKEEITKFIHENIRSGSDIIENMKKEVCV